MSLFCYRGVPYAWHPQQGEGGGASFLPTRRKVRGRRAVDLMIAVTALAWELPLFTRNPHDFVGLSAILEVVPITG